MKEKFNSFEIEQNKVELLSSLANKYNWLDDSYYKGNIDFETAIKTGDAFNEKNPMRATWNSEFFSCAVYFAKKGQMAESEQLLDKAATYIYANATDCGKQEKQDYAALYVFLDKPEKIKDNLFKSYDFDDLSSLIQISKKLGKPIDIFEKEIDLNISEIKDDLFERKKIVERVKEYFGNESGGVLEKNRKYKKIRDSFESLIYLTKEAKEKGLKEQVKFFVDVIEEKEDFIDLYSPKDSEIFNKIVFLKKDLNLDCGRKKEKIKIHNSCNDGTGDW